MGKIRRTVTLDPACDEWLRESVPSASGFINDIILHCIEMDMIDETQDTLDTRERVLRAHRNAIVKEIMELQRQADVIDETLEKAEGNRQELWNLRLDSLRKKSRDKGRER